MPSLPFCTEELQTIAQKKAELQRKIEEMEKMVKEQQANHDQKPYAQVVSHSLTCLRYNSTFIHICGAQ